MIDFLKKDILVIARDRTELIVLLFMPFILIGILGFALRGVLGGDTGELNMDVAMVINDNEQVGIEKFSEELHELGFPEEVHTELQVVASEISPYHLLTNMLEEESLQDMIHVMELGEEEAEKELMDGNIVAVLTIPENFTYDSLHKMLLNQGDGSNLQITVNDYGSLYASMFQDIIDGFAHNLNFETAISLTLGENTARESTIDRNLGGTETISAGEPINSFQYYTIGMAVMFVLFVGATISSKAYVEKRNHTFNRILLSGKPSYMYLGGKTISAAMITLIQLVILFSLSTLIFGAFRGKTIEFWLGMGFISIVVALCVGGVATLLTSIAIRLNSDSVSHIFSGGLVSLFAFVGGSFFPTSDMPAMVATIGNWTPNGAALTAYLQWMQGLEMSTLISPLSRIVGTFILLLIVSVFIFPKRRSASS
ncbi:ABC transporter permease [Evansella sp. AB-P1]|uniref:ABC transporter permease n=1 Tax=Evansella sp. AB-P1 TaxID=3037653 RepID=UPI00241F450F|nr:ABC transporter permease [Evansella sp. AB-P1]MDG5788050.1 ABC transporter permease [Evansella sp. AB-P1]